MTTFIAYVDLEPCKRVKGTYSCPLCSEEYEATRALISHIKSRHDLKANYTKKRKEPECEDVLEESSSQKYIPDLENIEFVSTPSLNFPHSSTSLSQETSNLTVSETILSIQYGALTNPTYAATLTSKQQTGVWKSPRHHVSIFNFSLRLSGTDDPLRIPTPPSRPSISPIEGYRDDDFKSIEESVSDSENHTNSTVSFVQHAVQGRTMDGTANSYGAKLSSPNSITTTSVVIDAFSFTSLYIPVAEDDHTCSIFIRPNYQYWV
ncbi:hypothetical protein BDF21DRAFT_469371 [Thamnidium elegans]|nr:hypothetical protein BDF21DRAFT_469371 [Thamnidium elegans]